MSSNTSSSSRVTRFPLNSLLEDLQVRDRKKIISELIYEMEHKKRFDPISKDSSFAQSRFYRSTPTSIHPSVEKWFKAMEMRCDGKITGKELQQAFETFQGKRFSETSCKYVVRLFDLDKNGAIDLQEFENLYTCIKQWVIAFYSYDREKSGYLDETELDCALKTLDINFTPEFIQFLIRRNNPKARKMSLDQYIITCIQIQRFTEEFKSRDKEYTGKINIKYEDFLEMIMRCL